MNDLTENRIRNFRSLYGFCADAIACVLSFNADKVCVPFALFALSALLLLTSCFVLTYQRCTVRQGHVGEVVVSIYCFLGNLCSTIGAVLSQQLDIQIVFGVFAVAVDVVNVVSIFLTLYMCWNSTEARRLRIMRRRRRQHLVGMCLLMGLGGYVTRESIPAYRPFAGRKLLHVFLQDNKEALGYTLGLISLTIACTSRFPAIIRVHRRENITPAAGVSAVLCASTGLLYVSALLLSEPSAPGLLLLLRAAPWLLAALCSAALDLLVLVIFWWRKGARRQPERISLDAQSLLVFPHFHRKHGNKLRTTQEKNNAKTSKPSDIGHYMDVSALPVEKESLLSARDDLESGPPTTRALRLVQVDGLNSSCSSCSSYDSSPCSSELEWDFEGDRTPDEFLQDWPKNLPPFGACTCGAADFVEMPL